MPKSIGDTPCSLLVALVSLVVASSVGHAAAPTAAEALRLRPAQKDVAFDVPSATNLKPCTIKAEKVKGSTAWIVLDPSGRRIRRFADTNGDNVVDQWSYYQNGLEVYRDIDANFNGKVDQHRWFHTAGTRWAIDRNEDKKIDAWRVLSAEEAAEEAIAALRAKDVERLGRVLLSSKDVARLGLGTAQQERLEGRIGNSRNQFRSVAAAQKVITRSSQFTDFGGTRPGLIPAGTEGSTKDLVLYENASALVETDGKHQQIYLGTMIRVGDVWKLVDVPSASGDAPVAAVGQFLSGPSAQEDQHRQVAADNGGPSEAEQELLVQLERLDSRIGQATGKTRSQLNERRAQILKKLATTTKDPAQSLQWTRQLADMISAEVQAGFFPRGVDVLKRLEKQLTASKASAELVAMVEYRRMSAEYGQVLASPKVDYAKAQQKRLEDLEAYVKRRPKSSDAADALLELGMSSEFAGEPEQAEQWYQKVIGRFARTTQAKKAAGAIRRLQSVGKELELRGPSPGGGTADLAELRGKYVLIQYWATWCEPCMADIARLKELYAKYADRGFAVIGVNLDNSPDELRSYLQNHRLPWVQIYEPGGLDSRPATELGVMTLPTMLLVDKEGEVLHRNIHIAELAGELKELLK